MKEMEVLEKSMLDDLQMEKPKRRSYLSVSTIHLEKLRWSFLKNRIKIYLYIFMNSDF
jgi:hypothetical protein